MSITTMLISIVCIVWWLRFFKKLAPFIYQISQLMIGPAQTRLVSSLWFFSSLILVSAFRPLLMLGIIQDTFTFLPHVEDTAFCKAQLGTLWPSNAALCYHVTLIPLHFLRISPHRGRVGWGTMTPSLSLFPPHLTEWGLGGKPWVLSVCWP